MLPVGHLLHDRDAIFLDTKHDVRDNMQNNSDSRAAHAKMLVPDGGWKDFVLTGPSLAALQERLKPTTKKID